MKKFKFKLEVVLGERKRVENLKLREYSLALQIMQKMIAEKSAMEKRLAEAIDEATKLNELPENNIGQIMAIDSFIKSLKIRLGWKRQEIERGNKLTERTRLEYVKASQKTKTLEKLKEKKIEEFKEVLHKRELKQMDDIYIMRAGSQRLKEEQSE